jgi:1,4-dihydroxy-2-naphthoate octaprenyltransferase
MRSALLHLRIPFSYFLMPVYFFAVAISPNPNESRLLWVFVILHLLLYPASNGFNSYFDKDEKSIGGLKNPPPVNKILYYLALSLDALALILGYLKINVLFTVMLLIYGMVSKAYSHPSIRLKKYPYLGWFTTGFFQGLFTVMMCYIGLNNFGIENLLLPQVLVPAVLTSVMLWANYPMTQIYQHDEDAKRGDITLSLKLGIKGTFLFTAIFFTAASIGFIIYFIEFHSIKYAWHFMLFLTPVLLFFGFWFLKVLRNETYANYGNTMTLNFISSTCLCAFFIYFFLNSTQILQAF